MYCPLVSIITIVYNADRYLEQTILSVLEQTYPDIEYIIIDGGSKDNSISIIEKYRDKLAYWVSEPDQGVSDAFNKGIKQAKGEIIGIINADDWYQKDAVEKAVEAIERADVAYGDLLYWKNDEQDMIVEGNDDYLQNEMTLNHPTVFIKTACYKKYGVYNLTFKYAMDYELLLRLKTHNCKFVHISQVLANMRWSGLSDQDWKKACKETLQIKDQYLKGRHLRNRVYYYKQITAIALMKFLEKVNMTTMVRFYRRNFSVVKKRY